MITYKKTNYNVSMQIMYLVCIPDDFLIKMQCDLFLWTHLLIIASDNIQL